MSLSCSSYLFIFMSHFDLPSCTTHMYGAASKMKSNDSYPTLWMQLQQNLHRYTHNTDYSDRVFTHFVFVANNVAMKQKFCFLGNKIYCSVVVCKEKKNYWGEESQHSFIIGFCIAFVQKHHGVISEHLCGSWT